jgi:hypothetical protein
MDKGRIPCCNTQVVQNMERPDPDPFRHILGMNLWYSVDHRETKFLSQLQ